ncbi:relaxase/mobilization nuclease domain-containing protein [Bosea eneae]|uniref:Relaxase/mobilization nuclease domain-containing protein n=1 Tax=Bosea eneae TaxID=151454 RepID=A0ABW0IYB2_9HYPH
MSLDQAVLDGMAMRMRARLAAEAEHRARRQSRAGEGYSALRPFLAARRSQGLPVGDGSPARPIASRFDVEDPPHGKAARGVAGARASRRLVPSAGAVTPAGLLAAGYQPAVLKVISYGHGVARATAIGQYIQRDQAALETHDGRILATQEAVAAEMKTWARDFDKRRESDDVATFRLTVAGETNPERLVAAVEAAFAGHRYAYRIDRRDDGTASARIVATMAGHNVVRGDDGDEQVRHRFHLSDARVQGDRRFSAPTRQMIADRVGAAIGIPAEAVDVVPVGKASHGKAGVVYHLSRLTHDGAARGGGGEAIATEPQVRAAAQAWGKALRSFSPRDTMHMILSAKAGEDKEALVRAARGFLHEQFAEHKFAFALHDDKEVDGHMHVHVIVAVKGEDGQRLRPGPADLRAWRELYAAQAQQQGLKIVATSAAYRASSQSYGPRDKSIVDVAERPRAGREAQDQAYAKANPHVVENARQRIQRARINPVGLPETKRQLAATGEGLRDWQAVAQAQPDHPTVAQYIARLTQSLASGKILVSLNQYRKASNMADATAAEMRENLKDISEAVALAAGIMDGATKMEFLRRTAATMEKLAIQTDLKANQESGRTHMSEDEVRHLLGPHADALIARAREIEAAEQREAERAEAIHDRAIAEQNREESSGAIDPASLREVAQDRAATRHAETIAARERREAQAAAEAARALAQNPNQRLDPNLAQGERLQELKRQQDIGINTRPIEGEEAEKQKPPSQRM